MNVDIDLYGRNRINVDTEELSLIDIQNKAKQEEAELLAKSGSLPNFGTIFSIDKQLFRIIYVNQGKKRISAVWYDDKINPFSGLPELGSSCSIYGNIYTVTFHNESMKKITIEPV